MAENTCGTPGADVAGADDPSNLNPLLFDAIHAGWPDNYVSTEEYERASKAMKILGWGGGAAIGTGLIDYMGTDNASQNNPPGAARQEDREQTGAVIDAIEEELEQRQEENTVSVCHDTDSDPCATTYTYDVTTASGAAGFVADGLRTTYKEDLSPAQLRELTESLDDIISEPESPARSPYTDSELITALNGAADTHASTIADVEPFTTEPWTAGTAIVGLVAALGAVAFYYKRVRPSRIEEEHRRSANEALDNSIIYAGDRYPRSIQRVAKEIKAVTKDRTQPGGAKKREEMIAWAIGQTQRTDKSRVRNP